MPYSEYALFDTYQDEQQVSKLEAKIKRFEGTIADINSNLAHDEFYEPDREEVVANREAYERELRVLRIQHELAVYTGMGALQAS